MKTALITTTIHIPHVLRLYRKYGPDVKFFVAGDRKTPNEAFDFLRSLDNCCILPEEPDYKCAKLIGHNSIQKRNLALLEAFKWGAEIIISVDDDNAPLDSNCFWDWTQNFEFGFDGLCAGGNEWFDPGTLLIPPAVQRGFPIERVGWAEFSTVVDAKVGVVAGTCILDPDTSAYFRIANHPEIHQVSKLLEAGIVVDPKTRTVFNSQATAIVRELAPAWSMWCGVSRFDDILASLVVRRVMRDRGYYVKFGKPLVLQQRNHHDLVKDLSGEIWGMQRVVEIAEFLDSLCLSSSVIGDCRYIFWALQKLPWLPPVTSAAALAFLDDAEKVL